MKQRARALTRSGRVRRGRAWRIAMICVGLAALLIFADVASSLFYRTDRDARLTVLAGAAAEATDVVVLFPGFAMSGDVAARSLRSELPAEAALIGVSYAERGVALDDIATAVTTELTRLRPLHVYFYGASMGGLVATYVAARYLDDGAQQRATLILDTAPAQASDVRRSEALMAAACHYPGGLLSSQAWSLFARFAPRVPLRGASPLLADEGRAYGRSVGTPSVTSQACFLDRTVPTSIKSPLDVLYVQASDAAEHDPLVDTRSALKHWRAVFPALRTGVVAGRHGSWHIPLTERPREVAAALALTGLGTAR